MPCVAKDNKICYRLKILKIKNTVILKKYLECLILFIKVLLLMSHYNFLNKKN
jgi:hypothetical protein